MILNRKDIDRLNVLKRRVKILEERINTDPRDLSYDKAEASALRWAIEIVETQADDPVSDMVGKRPEDTNE
jgi:hypothetical protein